MKFEKNRCLCSEKERSTIVFGTTDYNFNKTNILTDIRRCTSCGSFYPDFFPTASTLFEAYGQYYTEGVKRRFRPIQSILELLRKNYLARNIPKRNLTVLDFGCGSGEFLNYIHSKYDGLELFGYDPYPPVLKEALPFKFLDRRTLEMSSTKFEYITMGHVIEHLIDPKNEIGLVAELLAPGGVLWISTPNAESCLIEGFSRYTRDIDFPRHKIVFSKVGLKRLLESFGLTVTFIEAPKFNAVLNFLSCWKNVRNSQEVDFLNHTFILLKAVRLLLLFIFSFRSRNNPEIIVIATKPRMDTLR